MNSGRCGAVARSPRCVLTPPTHSRETQSPGPKHLNAMCCSPGPPYLSTRRHSTTRILASWICSPLICTTQASPGRVHARSHQPCTGGITATPRDPSILAAPPGRSATTPTSSASRWISIYMASKFQSRGSSSWHTAHSNHFSFTRLRCPQCAHNRKMKACVRWPGCVSFA
jgi:hypothetical protein